MPKSASPYEHTTQHYRTIWISDTHLGIPGAKVSALLDFLERTSSERLYLVGDIVDGWQLKKRFYWPRKHNDVIQLLLKKARDGTKVIYIPGNHDDVVRDYVGTNFGGIEIKMDDIHETADGKRLWIVHGDCFDNVIKHARWLAYIGDNIYVMLILFNVFFNKIRRFFNLDYWSLSQYIKSKTKLLVSLLSGSEATMIAETRRLKCDGVVCGHIHKPEMRMIGDILYLNDGDWVESMSALVEHEDGRLELLDWCDRVQVSVGGEDLLMGFDVSSPPNAFVSAFVKDRVR